MPVTYDPESLAWLEQLETAAAAHRAGRDTRSAALRLLQLASHQVARYRIAGDGENEVLWREILSLMQDVWDERTDLNKALDIIKAKLSASPWEAFGGAADAVTSIAMLGLAVIGFIALKGAKGTRNW